MKFCSGNTVEGSGPYKPPYRSLELFYNLAVASYDLQEYCMHQNKACDHDWAVAICP